MVSADHEGLEATALADDEFIIPTYKDIGAQVPEEIAGQRCTYLCGNSLGPLAKRSRFLVQQELCVWATRAVAGHFDHPHGREWMNIADTVTPLLADLVGVYNPPAREPFFLPAVSPLHF